MTTSRAPFFRAWHFSVESPLDETDPTSYCLVSPAFKFTDKPYSPVEEAKIDTEDEEAYIYNAATSVYANTDRMNPARRILIPKGFSLFSSLSYPSSPEQSDTHILLGVEPNRESKPDQIVTPRLVLAGIASQLATLGKDREVCREPIVYFTGKVLSPDSLFSLIDLLENPEFDEDTEDSPEPSHDEPTPIDYFFVGLN